MRVCCVRFVVASLDGSPMAQPEQQDRADIRPPRQSHSPLRVLRANIYDLGALLRDAVYAIAGFLIIVTLGALYMNTYTDRKGVEAVYESLKLLTFQSSVRLPANDPLGDFLFFAAPIIGIVLVTQGIISFGRRLVDKSSRRELWQVSLARTFHNHVIVCGLGRVGLRVATHLVEAGYEVVVVQRNWQDAPVQRALRMNIPVIAGDATEAETLKQAGIHNACAVIAVVNDDLTNLEIAIASQTLEPQIRVVLRIFDDEIDKKLDAQLNNGASFSTSQLAAPTLAAATLYRGIEYVLPRNGSADQLAIARFSVAPDGPLASAIGRSVEEFEQTHHVRLLKGTAGGSLLKVVPANTELHVLGRLADVGALAQAASGREILRGDEPADQSSVIVCGLGKVGYRVVTELSGAASQPAVIALDTSGAEAQFAAKVSDLPHVRIEQGDGAKADDLERAGADRAVAVAALTSDDLNNIKIALAARQRRPDIHVVVRVFNDVLAERLRVLFGIHTAYSASRLAAPTLAAAALLPGAECAFFAGEHLYTRDEYVVGKGDDFAGKTGEELRTQRAMLLIERERDGESLLLPPLDQPVLAGDRIAVVAPLKTLVAQRARR
jgi:Trk K+ transport system NAD-binding subunit